ncbi:MAG TPA: MFS transporter, partial [Accumulibacter sp.]|nr:MFS transporter [Accumulibacter sp.]
FEDNRFASVVGICMLIGNMGSVLAGAPLSWLAQLAGWRSIFVGVAVISVVLGIGCWQWVRDRPERPGSTPAASANRPRFDRTVVLSGLLSVLRNRATWPLVCINFGISGSFFAFAGLWITPFLTQAHGMSRATATTHVSLYFAGFAIGCVLIGALSDRLRLRKPVLILTSHAYLAIWLIWLTVGRLPLLISYTLMAIMGLLTASFTLSWACAKEVNPPQLSGMSTSVINMGGFLAGAILQPLVGWVMDQSWQGTLSTSGARIYSLEDFRAGMLLLAGTAAVGAFASWLMRETHCRNVWQEMQERQQTRKR